MANDREPVRPRQRRIAGSEAGFIWETGGAAGSFFWCLLCGKQAGRDGSLVRCDCGNIGDYPSGAET